MKHQSTDTGAQPQKKPSIWKKIPQWIVAAFLLLCVLMSITSTAVVPFIISFLLVLPISKLQSCVRKFLHPVLKAMIVVALVVFGFNILPKSERPSPDTLNSISTQDTEATITQETETTEPDTAESPTSTTVQVIGKDISIYDISFNKKVRNDVTGNWRVAQFAENIDFKEYALSYYEEFFESDSEVHFVINRNYGTTTRINVSSGLLFVSTYEYTDGEEHDAKKLPAGMLLGEWTIDISTGEIEDISN